MIGFEPTTSATRTQRSTCLSYTPISGNKLSNLDLLDSIVRFIKRIPLNKLFSDLGKMVNNIIHFGIKYNLINPHYHKCIMRFLEDGNTCEDEIMVYMREESFAKLIIDKINEIKSDEKQFIIVSIGEYHCLPLRKILDSLGVCNTIIFIDKL